MKEVPAIAALFDLLAFAARHWHSVVIIAGALAAVLLVYLMRDRLKV